MSSSQSRTWEMLTGAMAGSALESVWGGGTCSPRRITETRERQQNKQTNICFREFKTHTRQEYFLLTILLGFTCFTELGSYPRSSSKQACNLPLSYTPAFVSIYENKTEPSLI